MSDFTDQLDLDMIAVFMNVNEYGEAGTLTFDDASTRSVNVCFWEQRGALDGLRRALCTIHDNATTGATLAEIDGGMFITRANGEKWTVMDIQPGVKELICRCFLPRERT